MLNIVIEIMSSIIIFFLCLCGVAYIASYKDICRIQGKIKEIEKKVDNLND